MSNNIHRAMTTPIENTDTVPNQMENAMHNQDSISMSETKERTATNRENTIGRLLRRLEEDSEQVRITWSQWSLMRMAAGLEIDPETAEVMCGCTTGNWHLMKKTPTLGGQSRVFMPGLLAATSGSSFGTSPRRPGSP